MSDLVKAAALQPSNACCRPAPGADGPAVCRKPSDAGFQVDGHQVRHGERPQQLLLAQTIFPGVNDYGHTAGNALIATAGVDDHGHFAAVHPGVAGRGGVGTQLAVQVVFTSPQQRFANVGPVAAPQPFFGNGHVAVDLPFQRIAHVFKRHRLGKIHNAFHIHEAAVGGIVLLLLRLAVKQYFSVSTDPHDVGMVVHNAHHGAVAAEEDGDPHVKDMPLVHQLNVDRGMTEIVYSRLHLIRRDPG